MDHGTDFGSKRNLFKVMMMIFKSFPKKKKEKEFPSSKTEVCWTPLFFFLEIGSLRTPMAFLFGLL